MNSTFKKHFKGNTKYVYTIHYANVHSTFENIGGYVLIIIADISVH